MCSDIRRMGITYSRHKTVPRVKEHFSASAVAFSGARMETTLWDSSNLQDRALVSKSQNGDQDAFEALIQKYQHQLLNLVCWHAGPAADTDDILQLILCKVYFSLKSFDVNRPFYPWLRRIAVNRCCDERRRLRRIRTVAFADLKLEEAGIEAGLPAFHAPANPYYADRQQSLNDALHSVIARLPKEHRDIITLRHFEQMSYEEIAETLQCTARAARVKACRARTALRKLILQSACADTARYASSNIFQKLNDCFRKNAVEELPRLRLPRIPAQSNSRRYVMRAE
jgi:RNA polymerase sigma-70 factor, ECF subfamily